MAFVVVLLSGLDHIYLKESNMLLSIGAILTYFQLLVVFQKALCWVLYFSLFT